jgi:CheY-like chemotaxis protein
MLHFLVIDDNTERRIRLSSALRKAGAVVSEAETVKQGVEFSRRTEIDALVIDTLSAAVDGCKALDFVRREGIEAPVLLLADGWDDTLRNSCEAKGGSLLKKGASPKQLLELAAGAMAV